MDEINEDQVREVLAGQSEIREIDFSQFHPIDHWPGTARCRSLYGGPRHHLKLAWEYRWKSEIAARTLCLIGRHTWVEVRRRNTAPQTRCYNCHKKFC